MQEPDLGTEELYLRGSRGFARLNQELDGGKMNLW